jgi:hypothetical protein
MMTMAEPSPRKAVCLSGRSSGHGSARSNAAFTTQQPHRSSPTHGPGDQKNASHPTTSPSSPLNRPSLLTSAVARPRPNPHS